MVMVLIYVNVFQTANTEYAGGCLQYNQLFRSSCDSPDGLLVLPSGSHLNQLSIL